MCALPALRIIHPDDQPLSTDDLAAPSPEWTLLDFYLRHVRPRCLKQRSPKTWRQYEIGLWRWWQGTTGWTQERLAAGDDPLSTRREPRLGEITDETCRDWVEAMEDRGTTPPTLHKWATHLNYCLARSGPRVGSKRHFARLVDDPGLIEPPPVEPAGAKPGYTLDEMQRLLNVISRKALKPLPAVEQWEARVWWRSLLLFAYNTAMRPETLFQVQWEHFSRDERDREPDGAIRVLRLPAGILKGHRHSQTIWLCEAAWEAIQPLRRPSGPIFGWPWPKAETTLGRALNDWLDQAGIQHGRDEDRPVCWYGFRRAFSRECLAIPRPGAAIAAALMLNHRIAGLTILLQHYATGVGILRDVLPQLPQPGPVKQKRLFD